MYVSVQMSHWLLVPSALRLLLLPLLHLHLRLPTRGFEINHQIWAYILSLIIVICLYSTYPKSFNQHHTQPSRGRGSRGCRRNSQLQNYRLAILAKD